MEINVKVWKNFHWKKRLLIIRENDFITQKMPQKTPKKKKEENIVHVYPLTTAVIIDESKPNDYQILIESKEYKIYIKTFTEADKNKIIQAIGNIIKENTFQNVFKEYNEKMAKFNVDENEINSQDFLCCKLFLFKNLMNEMNQKIEDFKNMVKPKPKNKVESELMRIYNNVNTLQKEMEKQFQIILTYMNKYFDINENFRKKTIKLNKLLANRIRHKILYDNEGKENLELQKNNTINELSSDEENRQSTIRESDLYEKDKNKQNNINNITNENKDLDKEDNINKTDNLTITNRNSENAIIEKDSIKIEDKKEINEEDSDINSNININDEENKIENKENVPNNFNFNFNKRTKFPKSIIYPQNIIKEMISSMTQNKPAPVYFNEPFSMGERQCEKFFYLDLLKKVSSENKNKSLQLAYICAFIVGELFLSLNRNLKPFNPIIGETYEYFDNKNNFRYCSEQVCHKPQITAFIGETPEFALYGDTKNSTSFKILKGAMELSFKNKVHLHIKSSNDHFVYNRPNIMVKGFLKPPLYNDYTGITLIENELFPENKAELKFIEESWTNSVLGLLEGKIYSGDEVTYLIKGNWNNSIYLIDNKNKDSKIDLLNIDANQEYLKNGPEGKYELPTFCYNLNYMDKNLEESLPKNDSRFRMDMRLLEESTDTKEAQMYKEKYEEKQRKELNNENHKVLFFDEKFDKEGENYFIPNGKYWEMKNNGELKNNCNCDIFDVSKY